MHLPTANDKATEQKLADITAKLQGQPISEDALRYAVCEFAKAFVGICEVGKSNSGYWVDRFLKYVHLSPGHFWCLAFADAVYAIASKAVGINDVLGRDTGGTQTLWGWAAKNNLSLSDPALALPGDIVIWRNGSEGTGHAAIIVEKKATVDGIVFKTVEVNVGGGSWRNGGEVAYREWPAEKWGKWGVHRETRWTRGVVSLRKLYAGNV